MGSDIEDDNLEHRVSVKEIVEVQQTNERELKLKRLRKKKLRIQKESLLSNRASEQLENDMDYLAEQMAMEMTE